MANKFSELREKMSPEAREKAAAKKEQILADLPLQELRQARSLTQEQLAKVLETNQANISKLERRADMYVSTLRSYVTAMGGQLEITASFPEGKVRINQFEELEEEESQETRPRVPA